MIRTSYPAERPREVKTSEVSFGKAREIMETNGRNFIGLEEINNTYKVEFSGAGSGGVDVGGWDPGSASDDVGVVFSRSK